MYKNVKEYFLDIQQWHHFIVKVTQMLIINPDKAFLRIPIQPIQELKVVKEMGNYDYWESMVTMKTITIRNPLYDNFKMSNLDELGFSVAEMILEELRNVRS